MEEFRLYKQDIIAFKRMIDLGNKGASVIKALLQRVCGPGHGYQLPKDDDPYHIVVRLQKCVNKHLGLTSHQMLEQLQKEDWHFPLVFKLIPQDGQNEPKKT